MRGLRKPGRRLVCLGLAVVVLLAYAGSLYNDFTGYDDPDYVTANVHVNTGLTRENVAWAFTAAHASNWHPLTWISHALDCSVFGLAPAGHHFTSLLLHLADTLLLFLWLSSATGAIGRSAFVAAMFGLHPAHVESVAWVAERKDVLSTFFWMLTLCGYTVYMRRPSFARYAVVAACLTAGLLSKQMLVTIPLLLLLVDWWPLGAVGEKRTARMRLLDKVPLAMLCGLAGLATLWAQRASGALSDVDAFPMSLRLSNAVVSYVRYLGKTIWPAKLAVFYPMPAAGVPAAEVAICLAVILGISVLVWFARKDHPWLAFGWGWYLLTLLPVIGIVQVGMQAMADRYLYVPMVGLTIAAAWECAHRLEGRADGVLAAGACAVAVVCAVLTWQQVRVWKDGLTLFQHAVAVTDGNFVAHDNLGVELDRRGHPEEALREYRETLRIRPGDRHGEENYAMASFAEGERLFQQGKQSEAIPVFEEGLRYRPRNGTAHTYLGLIRSARQEKARAAAEFENALEIDPSLARAHMGLAVLLAAAGKTTEARQEFESTVRYDPNNAEAYYDLAVIQGGAGENAAALESLDAALRSKPDFGGAHLARAMVLYTLGRYAEAQKALAAARMAKAEIPPGFTAALAEGARR